MKCPKCQFNNPEGNVFCEQCGAKMEKLCPKCNSTNPYRFRFCGECGLKLTETSEKESLAFGSERKHATVLFSDLVGYTAMTERLDPEDVKEIMSRVFGEIAQVVTRYGGFIERFFGDEVMALFGIPNAHEDDPVRAIKAAREIHRVVEGISPKYEADFGLSLAMHTGINTGLLITGDEYIGKGRHGLTGDAVNQAARLVKLAQAGETLVGPETYGQAEGYFIFEHPEPKRIKGKAKPVKAYQVIAPSTRRTRFEVSAERGLTAFVGRENELEKLQAGLQQCKVGRGGAFGIVSEAGFGKSRLLYEFRKAVAREDVTFLEGKCLSYSKETAYQPVIDILKSNFDIVDGDGYSEVKEKALKGLKILGNGETSTLPYLLELLSVKDSGLDRISMSPEGRKNRIIQTLKRIVIQHSEIRPLIMAVEDLHWIDKSSEDTFKDLLDSLSGTRILLIFTYRPEYIPSWDSKPYYAQINLNRFSEEESLSMLINLLGTPDIDKALEELITRKTEGAPLFIEEFIKSLKDLKIIEKRDKYYLAKGIEDVAIPSTIQDIIMARVDLLPKGAKEVLQNGSAIEREFSYELIKRVSGFSEQTLLFHLSALGDSELVYERGTFPQTSYIFKHALTRDVVYDSILRKRRKKLHRQIGNIIEELYKDSIEEHYEALTKHYIAGVNHEKAAKFSKLARKKAEKVGSLNDAITYTKKWLASIEKLPKTDDVVKELIDASTILGLYYVQMNRFYEAKEAINPILNLAINGNYKNRLAHLYIILGAYGIYVEEDFIESSKHLINSLKISEETNNILSFVLGNYWFGNALSHNCEFERFYFHTNKALEINKTINNLWGIAAIKSSLCPVYCLHGKIDLAYQTSNDALQIADKSGDIYSNALSHTAHGISCYAKGFFEEAVGHLLKGAEFCKRVNCPVWFSFSLFNLGDAYFEMEKYQESKNYYNETVSLLEQVNFFRSLSNLGKVGSGKARVRNNEKDIYLESVLQCHKKNRIMLFDGLIQRYIADILLNIDDQHISEAEKWVKKAIETDKEKDMRWNLGRDYALYAELFKRKGGLSKAKENLGKAIEILNECGADGWVQKYEKKLAAFS